MEILLSIVLSCAIIASSAGAVPLASGIKFRENDGFFNMPGVGLRKVSDEKPVPIVSPAFTPLYFGNSESRDRHIGFSFGEPKKVLPDLKDIKRVSVVTNSVNVISLNERKVFPLVQFPVPQVAPNRTSKINTTETTPNRTALNVNVLNTGRLYTTTTANVTVTINETVTNNSTEMKPVIGLFNNETDSATSFLFRRTIQLNGNTSEREPLLNNTGPVMPKCDLSAGVTEFNGTCTRYLARNGCPQGEWFVKNYTNSNGCVSRPCPPGQLLFKRKCVDVTDETVCNDGQMLYVDFTGIAHCDCRPNFIYDPWSGVCFALGDQGYCNFGEHLILGVNGSVNCERNPCLMNGYVFHNESRRCYKQMFRGFCDEGFLIVHATNRTAECSAIASHSIFDLPTMRSCEGGTVRDYAGVCREEFRVPVLSSFPVLYGNCPFSFTKDSQGTCRKAHKLFG